MSPSDHDLLRDYARDGSQPAFAALVERHLNLVYSAARRQVRSPHLAEEVAQSVFADLARHASHLTAHTPLVAWLHVVTRRTAIDFIRRESRRQAREQQVVELTREEQAESAMKPSSSNWSAVEPLLDEAVESLNETDRAAILLRYFENKSLRDIGAALGASEDAAQKRVSRAVEQLRAFFLRRGVTVSATGLASDLSAHALQIAPGGLGTAISAAAVGSGAAGSVAAVEATKAIAMTTVQKPLVTAALVLAAGTGLYQVRVLARQSAEMAELRQQIDRTESENRGLRLARDAATTKIKTAEQSIDAHLAAALPASPADAALESQMQQWFGQLDRIKDFLSQRPELNIPELELLNAQDWFAVAATNQFDSEEAFRRATSSLRERAVGLAAGKIMTALNAYVEAHGGTLPNSPLDLAPHFDPPMAETILARYEMRQTGKLSDVPRGQAMHVVEPKAPADVEFDSYSYIGTKGYGNSGAAIYTDLREAQQQFAKANNGLPATTAEQLLPYLRWPVPAATLQKYLVPKPAAGTP